MVGERVTRRACVCAVAAMSVVGLGETRSKMQERRSETQAGRLHVRKTLFVGFGLFNRRADRLILGTSHALLQACRIPAPMGVVIARYGCRYTSAFPLWRTDGGDRLVWFFAIFRCVCSSTCICRFHLECSACEEGQPNGSWIPSLNAADLEFAASCLRLYAILCARWMGRRKCLRTATTTS